MRDEFYFETKTKSQFVSMDVVNHISAELIASVNSSDELNKLVEDEINVYEARKKALVIAYKEYPNPSAYAPLEDRKELIEKRNKLVEELMEKFLEK